MGAINYQKELDGIIKGLSASGKAPSVLLHSCCAPCSSYVLEYLSSYFDVTVLYYNPNITPYEEFAKRASEQERFIKEFFKGQSVRLIVPPYDADEYLGAVSGLESEPEGGARCGVCFRLRLEKTAGLAREMGFDYFATTLTVSPHKNAERINRIGQELSEEYGVKWLPSDFKKREGFKRSIELSEEYGLYRQNWCGCEFSRR